MHLFIDILWCASWEITFNLFIQICDGSEVSLSVSWMLGEGARPVGQRQRTLLLTLLPRSHRGQHEPQHICLSCLWPCRTAAEWISPVGTCTHRRWHYKSLLFGDQNLLDRKHACPPLWKKTLSYKAVFCVSSLGKNKGQPGLLFVKMCRKVRNPWRIALPQLWPTHSLLSSLRNGNMWQRTYPFISPYFPSVYFLYPVLSLTLLCKSVNHEALIILV